VVNLHILIEIDHSSVQIDIYVDLLALNVKSVPFLAHHHQFLVLFRLNLYIVEERKFLSVVLLE